MLTERLADSAEFENSRVHKSMDTTDQETNNPVIGILVVIIFTGLTFQTDSGPKITSEPLNCTTLDRDS